MKKIVTLTLNPTIDVATDAEKVVPTRKIRCGRPKMDPGGGGINVARVVHELGGAATAVFAQGGSLGQLLGNLLKQGGIEVVPVAISQENRESFTVNETSTGEQFRFVLPGPELKEREWREFLEVLEYLDPFPGYLVASGSVPPGVPADFYARAARLARERGGRFLLDTSGEALGAALEERVHLIKPNLRELRDLTGREIETDSEQEEACRELIRGKGVEIVALTLGDRGALLVTEEKTRRVSNPEVEVRSPIGAGDSFMGGMVLALSRGWTPEEAFLYGTAAGSAAVMTPGTELCRREDVEELFEILKASSRRQG